MRPWLDRVAPGQIEQVTRAAIHQGVLDHADRAVVFHDLDLLRSRIQHLHNAFPRHTLHAVAVKANPVVGILREVVDCGAGLEAASIEEAHIGLAAGCAARNIVFDSPAKTRAELDEALARGFVLNVDNLEELSRIDDLLRSRETDSLIGLRINPMVGSGSIGITSVADSGSKFGLRIDTDREAILAAFARHPWLRGLHIHVGSQGCSLELLAQAAVAVQGLRNEIEGRLGAGRIAFVDIGGGLPVAYTAADRPADISHYRSALQAAAPGLFSGELRLITEFGRSIQAGCGFTVSRVEYVKPFSDHHIAVVHVGADMFLRPVYLPQQWRHRYLAMDSEGRLKGREEGHRYSIGGPLCFAGDLLARNLELPSLAPGDLLAICDTGAYTMGMWSRHCSRGLPRVVGFRSGDRIEFETLLKGETPADVVRFWGGQPAG